MTCHCSHSGCCGDEAVPDRAAVVLHVDAHRAGEADLVQEPVDDLGEVVEGVVPRGRVGHLGVAEARVVRGQDVEPVGQGGDQVAELVRRGGEAAEEQQLGVRGVACLAVEDVQSPGPWRSGRWSCVTSGSCSHRAGTSGRARCVDRFGISRDRVLTCGAHVFGESPVRLGAARGLRPSRCTARRYSTGPLCDRLGPLADRRRDLRWQPLRCPSRTRPARARRPVDQQPETPEALTVVLGDRRVPDVVDDVVRALGRRRRSRRSEPTSGPPGQAAELRGGRADVAERLHRLDEAEVVLTAGWTAHQVRGETWVRIEPLRHRRAPPRRTGAGPRIRPRTRRRRSPRGAASTSRSRSLLTDAPSGRRAARSRPRCRLARSLRRASNSVL